MGEGEEGRGRGGGIPAPVLPTYHIYTEPRGGSPAPHGTIRDRGREGLGTLPTTSSIGHIHGSSSRCFAPTSSIRTADLQSFSFPITTILGGTPPSPPPCTLWMPGEMGFRTLLMRHFLSTVYRIHSFLATYGTINFQLR